MGLKSTCPHCANRTIPKRIVGVYIGAPNSIKIWECRDCFGLWSDNYQRKKIGDVNTSSI